MRHPTKAQSLEQLKALGLPIGTIIDVGVLSATPDLIAAFPDKKHLLLEPIVEWNEAIAGNYRNIPHELVNVAVSDSIGTATMELYSVVPGRDISHSSLTDAKRPPRAGLATREVHTSTLDQLTAERDLEQPYLLKIDVDGAETKILAGAKTMLKQTCAVVIEAHPHTFYPRVTMLKESGFDLFEVVDLCYYDGFMSQFDLVFVNAAMMRDHGLSVHPKVFDISKWVQYAPKD